MCSQRCGIKSSSAFADTKPHYEILDGLRGVAALLVVIYHIFEGLSFAAGGTVITFINHGYLAVDFFFILSGFVIGYAYDDRLGKTMKLGSFFKRRLIRLHPMIIIGAVIGALSFFIQGSTQWNGTHVAASFVILSMLCAVFLIPAIPGTKMDVRGNGEMFPLNGPSWSLFFEYIGNILYALFIHRLPTKRLACLTIISGILLSAFALLDISGYGMLGVGWTLDGSNLVGGFLRMFFPYTLGMLLARKFYRMRPIRGIFWIASLSLLALFMVPYINGGTSVSLNALYELACIVIFFPCIILAGASGYISGTCSGRFCKFMGDISYPLYVVHYPIMYLFYSWLIRGEHYSIDEVLVEAVAVVSLSIVMAWVTLKLYDEPVRRKLARKFGK